MFYCIQITSSSFDVTYHLIHKQDLVSRTMKATYSYVDYRTVSLSLTLHNLNPKVRGRASVCDSWHSCFCNHGASWIETTSLTGKIVSELGPPLSQIFWDRHLRCLVINNNRVHSSNAIHKHQGSTWSLVAVKTTGFPVRFDFRQIRNYWKIAMLDLLCRVWKLQ